MSEFEIVKFQLLTHCFASKIRLNDTELNLLALLGTVGETTLADFCELALKGDYLGTDLAIRSCLHKLERANLFLKRGKWKKVIYLNPELNIIHKGTILLDYKIVKKDDLAKKVAAST